MRKLTGISAGLLIVATGSTAWAADLPTPSTMPTLEERMDPLGRQAVIEMDMWGGYLWRDGNAINHAFDIAADAPENEDFPMIGGGALAAIPLGAVGLLQLETDGEVAFHPDDIGGFDVDDTYGGSITFGGHLAYTTDRYLLGVLGGVGRTAIHNTRGASDHNATHWFFGGEAKAHLGMTSLAAQGGFIDSQAENHEVFSDAWFARGIGQYFLNGGQTMVQGDVAYFDGIQDEDDGPADQNDIYGVAWGAELEHGLNTNLGGAAASVFLAYDGLYLNEDSSLGTQELTDHTVRGGFKVRLGAMSPYDREHNTAPDMPNVGRWMGATPAID